MDSQTPSETTQTTFNFDEWMNLAKNDPEAFEAQRQAAINAVIDASEGQRKQRLQGLQWQVDHIVQQSQTPLSACLSLSRMMWDKVQGENGLVDVLDQLTGKTPLRMQAPQQQADVIPFQRETSEKSTSAKA